MFNRFTDGAKQAMGRARQEALDLNHDYIGSEHILLALARPDAGVASELLARFRIGFDLVRQEVERLTRQVPVPTHREQLPFTPSARRLLEQSLLQASRLGHGYVGTEHLLLALLELEDAAACQVLSNLGANPPAMHTEIVTVLGGDEMPPPAPPNPNGLAVLLKEIRDELRAIRRLLEERG